MRKLLNLAGNGTVFTEAKKYCGVKVESPRYADLRKLYAEVNNLKAGINAGRYTADYLYLGKPRIRHGKRGVSAQI